MQLQPTKIQVFSSNRAQSVHIPDRGGTTNSKTNTAYPSTAIITKLYSQTFRPLLGLFTTPATTMDIQNQAQPQQIRAIEHHAFPIHAGHTPIDGKIRAKVKIALEDCVGKLQRKLHKQAVEASPAFEVTLHHCKSAIDSSLMLLYPPPVHSVPNPHNHYERDSVPVLDSSQPSSQTIYKAVSITDSDQCQWKRRKSWFNNHECSRNVCDWARDCHYDRCYKRNKHYNGTDCRLMYLNDSADDFLDNAPPECNFCLPKINCELIDNHCLVLETREANVLLGVLIGCGVAVALCCIIIWTKAYFERRKIKAAMDALRARSGVDGNNDMVETRTPVLPTAQGNTNITHLGPARRSSSNVSSHAFENPRPAPQPPISDSELDERLQTL